jgi:hypothetical protein
MTQEARRFTKKSAQKAARRIPMRGKLGFIQIIPVILALALVGSGLLAPTSNAQSQITSPEKFF